MKCTQIMFCITMMTIVVFVIIITDHNLGVLMVNASWSRAESLKVHREKTEGVVLENFRALLGLRTNQNNIRVRENGSPAPSPSPISIERFTAEAPGPTSVPAPVPTTHHHRRSPRPRPKFNDNHQQQENRRRKIITIATVVPTGVVLLVFALGVLLCVGKRMYQRKKVAIRTASVCSDQGGNRERSKSVKTQELASKVTHELDSDVFYIETLTTVLELEPQTCTIKETFDSLDTSTMVNMGGTSHERKSSDHEATQAEPTDSNCLAEEIISVHEYTGSSRSDDQSSVYGDKVYGIDNDSSDDESFHSLCDWYSLIHPNLRLSNVSNGSFSDSMEVFSTNHRFPPSPQFQLLNQEQSVNETTNAPNCLQNNTQPPPSWSPPTPPPPPPPPPPTLPPPSPSIRAHISPLLKTSHTSKMVHNSSSGSEKGLASSQQNPKIHDGPQNIPPPPCLPPFTNGKPSSSKGPPPPPEQPQGLASPQQNPKIHDGPQNIPPPPCLPPFPNGKPSLSKGPPPPPEQPPPYTPLGKDGTPLPKLKPLHWDKVRAAPDRSMVWDKLRCSSFELDEEMIESLFGYNLKTVLTNDEGNGKNPSSNKHVLEHKRLQNITILSKAINTTVGKVCEALVQGEGLSSQQLEALVKMVPTEEEEANLSNYKGDIDELGSAERLVKKMLTIPNAFQRVEAMLYRATFDDEVVHLRNSFQMLEEACKELRSSRLFLKLLEAVLKTGNRMNVGTIRGGARAFKLDALLKLADVKGTNGKTTLLHFVVQEMIRSEGIRMSNSIMGKIDQHTKSRTVEEKEDNYRRMGLDLVSGLSTELCNVKRTASIDLDVLARSVSNLSDGMSKLQQFLNKNLHHTATNENFFHTMKTFINHAESNLKELQAEENKVLLSVREITEYYHGDVSKDEANPLRIFVIVRDFLGMLDQVCRELKSFKIPRTPNPLGPFR